MTKKQICWQKYIDPLQTNIQEFDPTNEVELGKEPEEDFVTTDIEDNIIYGIDNQKIISTPFGLLTVNSNSLATSNFDFWIMHTNFDITPTIAATISNIEGVETIEILTRYRARIGFPISEFIDKNGKRQRLFSSTEIKQKIEKSLLEKPSHSNITIDTIIRNLFNDEVLAVFNQKRLLASKYEYWAMLILPNGNIQVTQTDNKEEYEKQYKILNDTSNLISGYIVNHIDYD
jgi:hypothetical protein